MGLAKNKENRTSVSTSTLKKNCRNLSLFHCLSLFTDNNRTIAIRQERKTLLNYFFSCRHIDSIEFFSDLKLKKRFFSLSLFLLVFTFSTKGEKKKTQISGERAQS